MLTRQAIFFYTLLHKAYRLSPGSNLFMLQDCNGVLTWTEEEICSAQCQLTDSQNSGTITKTL
jgi:hypothetical protein